jgi:hypothetical protein
MFTIIRDEETDEGWEELPPLSKNHKPPRHRDAMDTEIEAGKRAEKHTATNKERTATLLHARGSQGLTSWELHELTGMPYTSAAPCFHWLHNNGYAKDTGRRRDTAQGSPAAVWVFTKAGRRRFIHDYLD